MSKITGITIEITESDGTILFLVRGSDRLWIVESAGKIDPESDDAPLYTKTRGLFPYEVRLAHNIQELINNFNTPATLKK
jgi:hypothetical protein